MNKADKAGRGPADAPGNDSSSACEPGGEVPSSTITEVLTLGGFNPSAEDLKEWGLRQFVAELRRLGCDVEDFQALLDDLDEFIP